EDLVDDAALAIRALRVLDSDLALDAVATQDVRRTLGRQDPETQIAEDLDREDHGTLVPVGHGDEDGARGRQAAGERTQLALGEGRAEVGVDPHDLTGR